MMSEWFYLELAAKERAAQVEAQARTAWWKYVLPEDALLGALVRKARPQRAKGKAA